MAGKRRNQSAAIRFGPALKASFLCLLIAGSAVGYVWQKSQIYQLGQQIRLREARLAQCRNERQRLADQLAALCSPVELELCAPRLGLAPAQPNQVRRLPEPATPPANDPAAGRLAAREAGAPPMP